MIVIRRKECRGAGLSSHPPPTGSRRETETDAWGWHWALMGRRLSHPTGLASPAEAPPSPALPPWKHWASPFTVPSVLRTPALGQEVRAGGRMGDRSENLPPYSAGPPRTSGPRQPEETGTLWGSMSGLLCGMPTFCSSVLCSTPGSPTFQSIFLLMYLGSSRCRPKFW